MSKLRQVGGFFFFFFWGLRSRLIEIECGRRRRRLPFPDPSRPRMLEAFGP